MKYESLKQREHRVSYLHSMGIRIEGMMHDRFSGEPECPKCEEMPCVCEEQKQKEEQLNKLRGGQ